MLERNTQLRLMEQICSTAVSVLIRLGPRLELGHDRETAELLQEVYRIATKKTALASDDLVALRIGRCF